MTSDRKDRDNNFALGEGFEVYLTVTTAASICGLFTLTGIIVGVAKSNGRE